MVPHSTQLVAQANESVDELRQRRERIEQERQQVEQERNRIQDMQESSEERLEGLEDQISATSQEIQRNEAALETAEQRLQQLQTELAQAESKFQDQQRATTARLQFLQRQQGSQGWAVLLQSENINEFLERRSQLRRVYDSDREFLDHLKTITEDIQRRRSDVERQKNEIALITQRLQVQKAEFEDQAESQEELVARLSSDRQALEAAEERLQSDSNDIAALIRQRLNTSQGIIIQGTGIFSLPSGGRLTSGFGYRVHPILGYRRFHAGIDFGAPHGSTIRAADSGTIIFAGWYGGYGRSVIIDHGGGLTTLYAHTSEIYVSENQSVEQGQAIAAIGSTGLSTGPHLHFEVRRNGDPVNPLEYL
ncbi:murein hydrolase activator EnvC family protein [Vacuolonema iberomarrocanum]|uniref:murein hydrolase activator EnvC family protein n=1 Tax=Vacuolonema iberomarrocanum TaxID=3454632 RepID=UPI0019DBBDC9|nr:peptidoglycan DD-metalloendopeptidase family protein [filamentous cyanobacterium LEGE 07170]